MRENLLDERALPLVSSPCLMEATISMPCNVTLSPYSSFVGAKNASSIIIRYCTSLFLCFSLFVYASLACSKNFFKIAKIVTLFGPNVILSLKCVNYDRTPIIIAVCNNSNLVTTCALESTVYESIKTMSELLVAIQRKAHFLLLIHKNVIFL